MAPFSIDECDCSDVYITSPAGVPFSRASGATYSRAAASACMLPTEAVSNTIPNHSSERPIHSRNHPSETCSNSATAGDVFQCNPLVFNAAASISPITAGVEPVHAKYAMNPGWFQCVTAGITFSRKSLMMASNDSPRSGPDFGRASTKSPGAILDTTG